MSEKELFIHACIMQEKDLDEMLPSVDKSFETQSERCCQLETSCLKKRLFTVVVILTPWSESIEKQKLIVFIRFTRESGI